jgi:hypothetical protein
MKRRTAALVPFPPWNRAYQGEYFLNPDQDSRFDKIRPNALACG